jgi:hypothetical protein
LHFLFDWSTRAANIPFSRKSLIGWSDRGRPYDHHNLIFDVPWRGMPREKESIHNLGGEWNNAIKITKNRDLGQPSQLQRPIFSTIKHYPPPWALKLQEQETEGVEARLSTDTF